MPDSPMRKILECLKPCEKVMEESQTGCRFTKLEWITLGIIIVLVTILVWR